MPQLHGYVLTSPKQEPSVKVILKGPEPEEVNPVLATWNYGTGRAAAYTSDFSPNWAKDWMDWEQLPTVHQPADGRGIQNTGKTATSP